MILMGTADDPRVGHHREDARLIGQQDIMPTLLDLCGIEIPGRVEGLSMFGERRHSHIYGEDGEEGHSSR